MRHIISYIFIISIFLWFYKLHFLYAQKNVNFVSDCCMKGRLQFGEWIKFEFVIHFQPIKSN